MPICNLLQGARPCQHLKELTLDFDYGSRLKLKSSWEQFWQAIGRQTNKKKLKLDTVRPEYWSREVMYMAPAVAALVASPALEIVDWTSELNYDEWGRALFACMYRLMWRRCGQLSQKPNSSALLGQVLVRTTSSLGGSFFDLSLDSMKRVAKAIGSELQLEWTYFLVRQLAASGHFSLSPSY